MILNALSGKSLPLYGDGSQIRDWLYVEDHVDALYEVLINADPSSFYNIGGNNEYTNLEIVKIICDILHAANIKKFKFKSFADQVIFVKDRPGHDLRYALDSSKIFKELMWTPKVDFYVAMEKTVNWYINNKFWWQKILNNKYSLDRLGAN